MEQRRYPRFTINQPVTLTVLAETEKIHTAVVTDASGRGLGLRMEVPLQVGAALKFDMEGALLLASVKYCRETGGAWQIGLELDQVLCASAELDQLAKQFDAGSGRKSADALEHREH